ncbi:NFACT family protein, partial [Acidianus sp. RZ1]|uniref:NFACT family protein n=1 Tax=Acidianus sp. RZ1 TaxID=1540082 RepID=UPI001492D738
KNTFNDAIDDYFIEIEKDQFTENTSQELANKRGKIEKTIENIEKTIDEYNKKAEELRKIGKILMENYVYVENVLKSGNRKMNISDIVIELNPRLSAIGNSSMYFDMAKEYAQKAKRAEEKLNETKQKLVQIEQEMTHTKRGTSLTIRKKEKKKNKIK